MEKAKKHWPIIAGALAVAAVGTYLVIRSRKRISACSVSDIDSLLACIDKDTWPEVRRIVDFDSPKKTQQQQLDLWVNRIFKEFTRMHGPFQTTDQERLDEAEFLKIYDLIESISRFQLHDLRKKNELSRASLF